MKRDYEYIVVGCGGIGSATAYWLARRAGTGVLGIEQFELGHHHGGSQDFSRIIRLTYFHEDYTKLTAATYDAWAVLEEESGVHVVTKTGSIQLSPLDYAKVGEVANYAEAMDAAGIAYDRIDGDEVMRRFPQFTLREPVDALYQADTGIADAIKGNAAHAAISRFHGATILDHCPVRSIAPHGGGVTVDTEQGTFTCRIAIVTAGAWTQSLLSSLGIELQLTVTQEQVTYYATPHIAEFAVGRFPIFISHADETIYGFPVYGEVATKVGIDASGPVVTTETRTYEPDIEREQRQETWLAENIPRFLGPKMYTKTCLYTMPKDRAFIIDRIPERPQIILCVGAGHAYKFAGLFGKILSELAIDGKTDHPIEPFVLDRPAITDSNYPAKFRM